jgi:hypothetical protein
MQGTRHTTPIRTKPESLSSPCVQNPARHPLMIGSGAHQAPYVARIHVSKRAGGGAGHKPPYAGEVQNSWSFLYSRVLASWINVNNCPTRCDFVQFLFPPNCSTYFGWYLHPSSRARVHCNYSIWHSSNRMLPSAVVEESVVLNDSGR